MDDMSNTNNCLSDEELDLLEEDDEAVVKKEVCTSNRLG